MTNSIITSTKHWCAPVPSKPSPLASGILFLIRIYQEFSSGRPSPCRFYPSCSHYAFEAIEGHGAFRGSLMALRRLSRCRPFGPHGVDLVPEPRKARSAKS